MALLPARSFRDFYEVGRAEALLRRPRLSFLRGRLPDLFMAGAAAMADYLRYYAAQLLAKRFLDTAKGADLTTLVWDIWKIQRFPAVKAIGDVQLSRTVANAFGVTIPAGTVVATQRDARGNEVRFVTLAPAAWLSGEGGDKPVAGEAELAGTAGSVNAGSITRILSSLSEAFTVTNVDRFVGGAPEESDEELRERARLFHATLRRATKDALESGARQVAVVRRATAIEDATGLVTVYVTDAQGLSNSAMAQAVLAKLEHWRAAGAAVTVSQGILLSQDVVYTMTVRAGVSQAALRSKTDAAIRGAMNKLKIGETLYRDTLRAAIIAVDPRNILAVTFTTPTDNVTPAANEIIRAGTIAAG